MSVIFPGIVQSIILIYNNLHINFHSEDPLSCLQILDTIISVTKNVLIEMPL